MKPLMQDTSGTGMLLQLHMQELKQEWADKVYVRKKIVR